MSTEALYFNLHPVNFVIISGILQNFIVAGILFFTKSDQPYARKLLSIAILVVNLHLTYVMLLDLNVDNLFPFTLWIPYSYLTALGPLIFFYTKSLTQAHFRISAKEWIHFIPVAIEWLLQLAQILYSIFSDSLYYNTPTDLILTTIISLWATGSVFYYLRRSIENISNHEKWILKNFSNLKEVTLAWLSRLITYYRRLWTLWIPFAALFLLIFRFQHQYLILVIIAYFFLLIITYLTYWTGIQGLVRLSPVSAKEPIQKGKSKSYGNLPKEEIEVYSTRMERLMQEKKLFLHENLSLREFAAEVNAEPNLVSYILNTHMQRSFYEFVNSYRIEEAKSKLSDPAYERWTILAIGLESGFNSKTSFNRVFREITGVTPSDFQKKAKENRTE